MGGVTQERVEVGGVTQERVDVGGVTQERDGDGRGHTGKVWRSAGSHCEMGGVTQRGCSHQWQCVPDHDCHL